MTETCRVPPGNQSRAVRVREVKSRSKSRSSSKSSSGSSKSSSRGKAKSDGSSNPAAHRARGLLPNRSAVPNHPRAAAPITAESDDRSRRNPPVGGGTQRQTGCGHSHRERRRPGHHPDRFPGYSGKGSLEEISWDDWFEKFEEKKLAFLHQDQTAGGKKSNFNNLISR